MTGQSKVSWGSSSHVIEYFPMRKKFGNHIYELSPTNPTLVKNTSESRAKKDLELVKDGGYRTGRIVRYNTFQGIVYIVYERRVRPVYGYSSSTGKRKRMG